ncbi:MAG TPA: hypothetical protein VEP93_13405, partial [Variovorax sp.]|nr:hypothetical protein [Variovorax sp.]
ETDGTQPTNGVQPARTTAHATTGRSPLGAAHGRAYTFTHGSSLHSRTEAMMLIKMTTVPQGQDPHVVVAWIRACIWAGVEGWPFCRLK